MSDTEDPQLDGVGGTAQRLLVQFISEATMESAYVRYRTAHLYEQLTLRNVSTDMDTLDDSTPLELTGDVLVLNRIPFVDRAVGAVEAARSAGKALVYSVDDLLFEDEFARQVTYHRNFRQDGTDVSAHVGTQFWRTHDHFAQIQRRMLEFSDCAVVTTDYLARRVRARDKPAYVIRNAMSREMEALSRAVHRDRGLAGGRVAVGYLSGSGTHDHDFAEVAPVLASLLSRHWNVYLVIVGPLKLPPCLEGFGSRIRRHPYVDWRALPGLISDLDINLAPLDMLQPFTHAKSEIKWMEAGAVGVPTVASATSGFAEAVRHGVTGLLANSPEEWEKTLEALVTQPEMRMRLGTAARDDVFAHYTAEARSRETLAVFAEVAERYSRPQAGPAPVVPGVPAPSRRQRAARQFDRSIRQTVRNWQLVANPFYWGRLLHTWDPRSRENRGTGE